MQTSLLKPQDPKWDEILAVTRHDTYHLASGLDFATRWESPGTPVAFVAEEAGRIFFVPLIVRTIPDALTDGRGWRDATGPRGYPGPIVGPGQARPEDDPFVERAIASMSATLREDGIVSAYVRLHPLLSPGIEPFQKAGTVVDHGESVSIDLTRSAEDVWSVTRQNHRRSINAARRQGYRVRVDDGWERLDGFMAIYAATMERLGAASQWRLPLDYVADLRAALGGSLFLCVVELGSEIAAGALLSEVDGIVEYHLSGTAQDHVVASPTKLLIDEAGRWARQRGDRVLHLAGSPGKDDSLIHFKRGFSDLRHDVRSWRLVSDEAAYQILVGRQKDLARQAPIDESVEALTYFPAYRLSLAERPS